jgi:hypothetical protein
LRPGSAISSMSCSDRTYDLTKRHLL